MRRIVEKFRALLGASQSRQDGSGSTVLSGTWYIGRGPRVQAGPNLAGDKRPEWVRYLEGPLKLRVELVDREQ